MCFVASHLLFDSAFVTFLAGIFEIKNIIVIFGSEYAL